MKRKRTIRILVVEDEPILRRTVTDRLTDEGYSVRAEKDGTSGLNAWREQPFDLILLDMNFKTGQVTGNEGIFWMNKIREKDFFTPLKLE